MGWLRGLNERSKSWPAFQYALGAALIGALILVPLAFLIHDQPFERISMIVAGTIGGFAGMYWGRRRLERKADPS